MSFIPFVPLNIRILIYLGAIIFSLSVIFYFLIKGRKTSLLFSYLAVLVVVILASIDTMAFDLSYLYKRFPFLGLLVDLSNRYHLHFFLLYSMCLFWLIFCLLYTDSRIIKNRMFLIYLAASSLFFYGGGLFSKYHNLFNLFYHPLYWLTTFVEYAHSIIGIVLLVVYAFQQSGYRRKQSLLLALAMFIPLALLLREDFGWLILGEPSSSFYSLNTMSIALSLVMLILAFATIRYRLNIMPVALKKLVDNLKQPIIVIDAFNKIMYFNHCIQMDFKCPGAYIKMNGEIRLFVEGLRDITEEYSKGNKVFTAILDQNCLWFDGELCLQNPVKLFYAVNIQPVQGNPKEVLGRIITFINITEYKQLMEVLHTKNEELQTVNAELQEHAAIAEELAIVKERNRFSRDAHDTLGHTMTMLIKLLEVGMITCKTDPAVTEEKLRQAIQVTREGLQEIKASIAGLSAERLDAQNLAAVLKKMMADFRSNFKVEIILSLCELPAAIHPRFIEAIYRACQEGITNAIRHGKAGRVVVVLRLEAGKLWLSMMDNGIGCAEIQKGGGLRGMEARMAELGGIIDYHSEAGNGFNINIELPVEGPDAC